MPKVDLLLWADIYTFIHMYICIYLISYFCPTNFLRLLVKWLLACPPCWGVFFFIIFFLVVCFCRPFGLYLCICLYSCRYVHIFVYFTKHEIEFRLIFTNLSWVGSRRKKWKYDGNMCVHKNLYMFVCIEIGLLLQVMEF